MVNVEYSIKDDAYIIIVNDIYAVSADNVERAKRSVLRMIESQLNDNINKKLAAASSSIVDKKWKK